MAANAKYNRSSLPYAIFNSLMFQDGLLSAIPYAAIWLVMIFAGLLADFLRSNNYLSTIATRKVFNTLGLLLPAGIVMAVSYVGCDHVWAITLLTLALGSTGIAVGGYQVNHLDIAPNFSGVLLGITNSLATIPGFLAPQVVGILTDKNETIAAWRQVFIITAVIYVLGALVFLVLARGEEQSWNKVQSPKVEDCSTTSPTIQASNSRTVD